MMSRMTFTKRPKIGTELSDYAHDQISRLWRRCARAFFRAASQAVMVDTGMSLGSMLPLAAKVRAAKIVRERLMDFSEHKPKKGFTDIKGKYHPQGIKSIAQGEREGAKARNILEYGTSTAPNFKFQFALAVFQYVLHEHGLAGGSGPWESLEKGREAFLQEWKESAHLYINAEGVMNVLLRKPNSQARRRVGED